MMSVIRRGCRRWFVPQWSSRWSTLIHHHVRRTTSIEALKDLQRPSMDGIPNSIVNNRKDIQGRDVNAMYVSSHHNSIDNRTPLMAALLATPRHKANAIMAGSKRIPSMQPDTIYGYTFCKDGKSKGSPVSSEEVRLGLHKWQSDVCDIIMSVDDIDVNRKDHNGCTTMHLAAASGNREVINKLLNGVDKIGGDREGLLNSIDNNKRTPADLALAWGWDNIGDYLVSIGGGIHQRDIGNNNNKEDDGIDEYDIVKLNKDRVIKWDYYLNNNRPVIIRSLLPRFVWDNGFNSIPESILTQTLAVSQIPYGKILGYQQESIRLAQYIQQYANHDTKGMKAPLYGFDASLGHKQALIKYYAEALLTLLGPDNVAYARYPQFGIGPPKAGSQMHTHHAALNLLLCGRKKWLLTPSRYSFWSHLPSGIEWNVWRDNEHVIELEQLPGDILYIPEFWGHATLIEENAATVAIEFIPMQSIHA